MACGGVMINNRNLTYKVYFGDYKYIIAPAYLSKFYKIYWPLSDPVM